jgi:hypothetical protein
MASTMIAPSNTNSTSLEIFSASMASPLGSESALAKQGLFQIGTEA